MKTTKKNFRHESVQDEKTIQKIISSISQGIAKGELKFSDEDDEIVFQPEGLMQLKLSATQEGNQQRFNIKVSWQTEDINTNKVLKVK